MKLMVCVTSDGPKTHHPASRGIASPRRPTAAKRDCRFGRAEDPRGVLGITAGEVNALLVRQCARVSSGSVGCFT